LYWLLAGLAREGPLVVAVDDAQWADEPSIGFLRHLATRLEHLPVLLLIASRPDARPLDALVVDPAARVVRPAPLSADAVEGWVSDALARPAEAVFVAACQRATGGNPFLLAELLREVRAEGLSPNADGVARLRGLSPRGVTTSVLLRLAGLSAAASALARCAAVLGEAELPVVAAFAGLGPDAAVEASGALIQAGVLERAATVRFVHPVVRTVLYEDMPAAERALAHGRAALHLHAAGAGAAQVAAQLVLAGPIGESWALAALRTAARDATLRGAPEVAARFLQRALGEAADPGTRCELMLALGRVGVLAGHGEATDHLREAMQLAETPAQYARATVKLGRVLRYASAGGEAVELLQEAAARLGPEDEHLAILIEHELLAATTVSYEARRRLATRAERWWEAAARPPKSFFDRFVFAAQAVEAASRGDPVASVTRLADAALADGAGSDHLGRHIRLLVAYALMLVDRFEGVDGLFRVLGETASARGGADMGAVIAAQRALVSTRRGHVEAAETDAVEALRLAADFASPPTFLLTAAGALLWVAAERGEEPHSAAAAMNDDGDSLFGRHLNHARAALHVAQGRLEEGAAELLAVGERERGIGWVGPSQFSWRSEAALALGALGDDVRARELAQEELRLARIGGTPRSLGVALRANALLADGERRVRGLEEAVAVLERSGADLEHARALVDLGAWLRRSRQPARAREPLRRGFELASRYGGARLADRARQELLASGVRPRRTGVAGRDALTPSEMRVVELAARELMNREIAQALFITEKTVETHLGHAYAKLGLKSRRELSKALADVSE
jgi:DNA-binding NarL/FixJ family response regulator